MEYKNVEKDAVSVWRIEGLITTIIICGVLLVASHFWFWWLYIPGIIYLIYSVGFEPELEYYSWKYIVKNDRLDFVHGYIFKKRTVIPISKIQHLDISSGPIMRKYKLSNVEIYTAGNSHKIPCLTTSEAEEIVMNINSLILKENDDGKK